ncbi:MAG: hypothetical protein IKY52_13045 [Clostridia bacterium]|nr:hypothetical protein [Clostridia bacterium]
MKYYKTFLGVFLVTGLLAQVSAAASAEAETMAILEQSGGGADGIVVIGMLLVLSGVWLYLYYKKTKNHKNHRRHHHSHHSKHS